MIFFSENDIFVCSVNQLIVSYWYSVNWLFTSARCTALHIIMHIYLLISFCTKYPFNSLPTVYVYKIGM